MHNSDPNNWTAPNWHPDSGDPEEELRMLREFCLRLLRQRPDYSVQLDVFEEGYMKVDLFRGTAKVGELYIVDGPKGGTRRFGLFLFSGNDEEEYYFNEIDEGLRYMPLGTAGQLGEH